MKKGYKQTEVGVIPEEWEVKPLKEISPKQSVGLVINPSTYFDINGTVPMLVGSNISEGSINWQDAQRITAQSNQFLEASRIREGDLVTVRVGEPGVTSVVPPELDECNCASVMIIRRHASFNSHWLAYVMNSRIGRSQIETVQYGTAQKQFNISDAVNFCYAVPPLPEQRAIAEALGDVDALITGLDELIAKKRDLKQATMQQLLTGKQRLPGFRGEWEERRLDDCATFRTGPFGSALHKSDYTEDGIPIINPMHIVDGRLAPTRTMTVTEAAAKSLEDFRLRTGDVIIGRRGEMGRCAVVQNQHNGWLCGTGSMIIRCGANIDPLFIQRILSSAKVVAAIEDASVGSTMINLNQGVLAALIVHLPPLPEQTAIAAILSDMDAEIEVLEKRLEKTRAMKQGMMQELLTGRIRLV